ncbi:MAG: zinc ribbon domain-containing protein [Thaumarchaeota archaeon]|nr:zinc ribbon domain-containing protein [Nitrososphaerota archaeon]
MAFGGDVDTLSLTFDKLQYIFNGYDTILDSFLEINTLHKQGNITDYEFFNKIQDSVMRFSALEFLAIKSIFEIKKSLYRSIGIITTATDNTVESGVSDAHVLSHSVSSFVVAGTLPSPRSQVAPINTGGTNCLQCRSPIRRNSKFCTNCGNKISG